MKLWPSRLALLRLGTRGLGGAPVSLRAGAQPPLDHRRAYDRTLPHTEPARILTGAPPCRRHVDRCLVPARPGQARGVKALQPAHPAAPTVGLQSSTSPSRTVSPSSSQSSSSAPAPQTKISIGPAASSLVLKLNFFVLPFDVRTASHQAAAGNSGGERSRG